MAKIGINELLRGGSALHFAWYTPARRDIKGKSMASIRVYEKVAGKWRLRHSVKVPKSKEKSNE